MQVAVVENVAVVALLSTAPTVRRSLLTHVSCLPTLAASCLAAVVENQPRDPVYTPLIYSEKAINVTTKIMRSFGKQKIE